MSHQGKPAGSPAAIGFFEHVQKAGAWPDTCFFEWRGSHDGLRHDPAGIFAISSGITWPTATAPAEARHRDWFARRYDDGFELGRSRHGRVYLHRYRTLDELTVFPDLDVQAANLAGWALETWNIVERDPLPFRA